LHYTPRLIFLIKVDYLHYRQLFVVFGIYYHCVDNILPESKKNTL
jgi:hypothetical protein